MHKLNCLAAKQLINTVFVGTVVYKATQKTFKIFIPMIINIIVLLPLLAYTIFIKDYVKLIYLYFAVATTAFEFSSFLYIYIAAKSKLWIIHVPLSFTLTGGLFYFILKKRSRSETPEFKDGRCVAPVFRDKIVLNRYEIVKVLRKIGNDLVIKRFNGQILVVNASFIENQQDDTL